MALLLFVFHGHLICSQGGRDIYAELNRVVGEHNDGVGGDRYDHTPFQKQNMVRIFKVNRIRELLVLRWFGV